MGLLVINEDTLDVSIETEVYVYLKNQLHVTIYNASSEKRWKDTAADGSLQGPPHIKACDIIPSATLFQNSYRFCFGFSSKAFPSGFCLCSLSLFLWKKGIKWYSGAQKSGALLKMLLFCFLFFSLHSYNFNWKNASYFTINIIVCFILDFCSKVGSVIFF